MSTLLNRRQVLIGGATLAASNLIIPRFGIAGAKLDKTISLHNIHTGEYFKEDFIQNGEVVPEVMKLMNLFMRDHRNNKTCEIDSDLIKLLNRLQEDCSVPGIVTFDVVSGYRSPETNAMLRRQGRGVAKHSYHMKGCAVDIKLPKHLRELRNLARSYKLGGVGYYPKSGFVHVDTRGHPAYWGAA